MTIRKQIEAAVMKVVKDRQRAKLWMTLQNPVLGWLTPNEMIKIRQGERLLKMVKAYKKKAR